MIDQSSLAEFIKLSKRISELETLPLIALWKAWQIEIIDNVLIVEPFATRHCINERLKLLGPFLTARGYDLGIVVEKFNSTNGLYKIGYENKVLSFDSGFATDFDLECIFCVL